MHGKPLLAWPIEAARASSFVDRVIISTDDPEFAAIAVAHGAEAPFLRSPDLASDAAPSIGFILEALDRMEASGERFDYLILLEPTSPLTDADDIDRALRRLEENVATAEAIVGIAALEVHHPAFAVRQNERGAITPYTGAGFDDLPRRQDLEELYFLDGSLYISTVDALRRKRSFCHDRTLGFISPRYKSLEVDDIIDFICIEAIIANLDLIRGG